jgi:hypothetical protein
LLGNLVVVASEQGGEHLGAVVDAQSLQNFGRQGGMDRDMTDEDRISGYVGTVLRLASPQDREMLSKKLNDEHYVQQVRVDALYLPHLTPSYSHSTAPNSSRAPSPCGT